MSVKEITREEKLKRGLEERRELLAAGRTVKSIPGESKEAEKFRQDFFDWAVAQSLEGTSLEPLELLRQWSEVSEEGLQNEVIDNVSIIIHSFLQGSPGDALLGALWLVMFGVYLESERKRIGLTKTASLTDKN